MTNKKRLTGEGGGERGNGGWEKHEMLGINK
jgi:hypothetical protein